MSYNKKSINEIKKPMNSDYIDVENMEGMPGLVDSTIAVNLLLNSKSAIRNLAIALTEIANIEAKTKIRSMLSQAIDFHSEINNLLISKGWFTPFELKKQFSLDRISAETALQIANLDLFPGDTSRLGIFATPNY